MFWLSFVRDADKAELGLFLFDFACFEMSGLLKVRDVDAMPY
jgi:hypothetical protein